MTPAQDFREARDWFLQHKRDPFLWLIILGPVTFFAINMCRDIVKGVWVVDIDPKYK